MSASRSGQHARQTGLRGKPLIMIGLLLASWTGIRAVTWEAPFAAMAGGQASAVLASGTLQAGADAVAVQAVLPPPVMPQAGLPELALPQQMPVQAPLAPPLLPLLPKALPAKPIDTRPGDLSAKFTPASPRMSAGHSMLLMAAFSQMEVPAHLLTYFRRPEDRPVDRPLGRAPHPQLAQRTAGGDQAAPYAVSPVSVRSDKNAQLSRWSGDGWLLWRQDNASPLLSGRPAYGRSQAGAVIRYALAPSSSMRPQAHLRASSALQGAREYEAAAGLSARPLARVPVRVAGEVRLAERASGNEVRPAVYAVTEIAPVDLPAGLTAEVYAQGGYVGGDFATGFADGQARVDAPLVGRGGNQLRAGGAVWGGAQRGASRVDVGPSASVGFDLGGAHGRLAADYRFRVAGDAQPASGPALTLSAGF